MSQNSSIDKIHKTIKYIEENVKKDITLDDISYNVNISKFHLNRIFKALTQQQLMRYVKNLKLIHSIDELLNTDLKIIDIALEYNFKYEQSYIRSFKNIFHISPGTFRKEKPTLEITTLLNTDSLTPIGEDGLIIKPKILIKPEFKIIGIKHFISSEENHTHYTVNKAGNDFFRNHKHKIKNCLHPDVYLGVEKAIEGTIDYHYMPSVEVSKLEEIPEGMIYLNIPTQKYAVFKYIGLHHGSSLTVDKLQCMHEYIYKTWLNYSGYSLSDGYNLESIDFSISTEDYCEVDLFLPIKK